MTMLSPEQRKTAIHAISWRASHFPRDEVITKLTAADKAFHLANVRMDDKLTDQKDSYSRFQELDNALGREVAESYHSYYTSTYLGTDKVFSMTSTNENKEKAQKFDIVMGDQEKQNNWRSHLGRWFLDISKYNLGAVDVSWHTKLGYKTTVDRSTSIPKTSREAIIWKGNRIQHIDMYNFIFDHAVDLIELSERGEFAGYIELLSQVELFKLIKRLKTDTDQTIYDQASRENPAFDIYKVAQANTTKFNMDYREPNVTPLGQTSIPKKAEIDWAREFGFSSDNSQKTGYTVMKFYFQIVPSSMDFPKTGTLADETVEMWEFHLLNGTHLLASKRLDNAHGLLPIAIAQTDADSLGINSAGPMQVAIPYSKMAKQLMDRVFAGADKSIRDRAIFDKKYLDNDIINSAIPDAKMSTKVSLPVGKSIRDVYHSIQGGPDTTGLANNVESVMQAGMRAAGTNDRLAGQLTPGNRTLEEFSQVQNAATNKQFIRALIVEATAMTYIKRIIKMNIVQYQEAVTIYDPSANQNVDIDPVELYQAEVDYKIADGLLPTDNMLSPNVQQQLLTLFGLIPDAFVEYDTAAIVAHILQQSSGINMDQYKLPKGNGGVPGGAESNTPPPAVTPPPDVQV